MWTMRGQERTALSRDEEHAAMQAKRAAHARREEAKRTKEIYENLDTRWASADRSAVNDTGGRHAHGTAEPHPALEAHRAEMAVHSSASQQLASAASELLAKHTVSGLGAHPKTPPARSKPRESAVPNAWARTQLTQPYTGKVTLEDRFAEFFENVKADEDMTEAEAREAAWWRTLRARWDARVRDAAAEHTLRKSMEEEVRAHVQETAPFA